MQATTFTKPMADRVLPNTNTLPDSSSNPIPLPPSSNITPLPPARTNAATHVPKEQKRRYPSSANAQHYANNTRRKNRWKWCCCCLSWLIIVVVLLGIAAGVFYLIYHPESPHYGIDRIVVEGMTLTSSLPTISPEFNLTIKADNVNNKIGIYYENDSKVEIYYKGIMLSNGVMPTFYQPSNNVTVFQIVLKGNDVELGRSDQRTLMNVVAKRSVPLNLKFRAPVKIKVGSVKTWKIGVNVDCDVIVNQLTAHVKIVHKDCHYRLDLWF